MQLRVLCYFIGLTVTLHAANYDTQLLNLYSKIAPRIALMTMPPDTNISAVNICILHEHGDKNGAMRLQHSLKENSTNGSQASQVSVNLFSLDKYSSCTQSDLFFFLDAETSRMRPALDFAKKRGIATMAYSNRYLQEGVLFSLFIGRTVRPFLNINEARKDGIHLDPLLLQISKLYTPQELQ